MLFPKQSDNWQGAHDAYSQAVQTGTMTKEEAAAKQLDLQKRQKHLEGDTSPDRPVVIDPRYKSPPKH